VRIRDGKDNGRVVSVRLQIELNVHITGTVIPVYGGEHLAA
jgi:hypothetical protein